MTKKFKIFALMMLSAGSMLVTTSCGTSETDNQLVAVSESLNTRLAKDVADNAELLASAESSYAEKTFAVKVAFKDSVIAVKDYSEALVQYYTALQLKDNATKEMESLINGLVKVEGKMVLTLSDIYGTTTDYTMTGAQLKHLFKSTPMQLNFQDVKANVLEILASRAEGLKVAVDAESAEFDMSHGFASYSLVFARKIHYSNQTQGSLMGRYKHVFGDLYNSYGTFRPSVEQLLSSLQIEGFSVIYTTKENSDPLKVTIPWGKL